MASGTIKSVVPRSDIVDNLTTNDSTKVLSAAQGYALNSKITNRVSLFNGYLSTSDERYNLSQSTENFMFISVEIDWYSANYSDNVAVFPASTWPTIEYFDLHRHNDTSQPYLRINSRAINSFNAKVSDVGVHVRIFGMIAK